MSTTEVLQEYYRITTGVLQEYLQESYRSPTGLLQVYYRNTTGALQEQPAAKMVALSFLLIHELKLPLIYI